MTCHVLLIVGLVLTFIVCIDATPVSQARQKRNCQGVCMLCKQCGTTCDPDPCAACNECLSGPGRRSTRNTANKRHGGSQRVHFLQSTV
uniref:Gsp_58 putative toxin n=1 Tax=Gemmula speciosa TaxID=439592 RepID=A0A098LXR9_GEMSP